MKRILMCSAVILVALAVQAQTGVSKAITDMEQQWAAASKASNSSSVAPLLADKFASLNSDGTMQTKEQTLAAMNGNKWETNEVSDVNVEVFGDTAIATGTWKGKGTAAGKPVDTQERWVDTWTKMPGGKWQCIASASAQTKM